MQDQSDKGFKNPFLAQGKGQNVKYRARVMRRTSHIKNPHPNACRMTEKSNPDTGHSQGLRGYDPELLYVECGRCGAPVIWEKGRAGRLLLEAGIDPLELDSSCILLTDGCPSCGSAREYSVRIFRLSDQGATHIVPLHGHA